MSIQTIGSAFIAINPDTSKTGAAVTAAMGPMGKQAGQQLGQGISTGLGSSVSGVGQQMSKFSGVIRSGVGGALGPITELGGAFSGLGETIKKDGALSAAGMASIGTGVAGAGLALMALGSSEKQANAQLSAAITATGQATEDYKGKIEETVKADENLGISAANTDRALQSLVTITGDTGRATDLMSTATNLAAARHISLTAAATQVGKAAEGNTRLFKMYGIEIQTNADGTKNIDGALDELSKRLNGQASASVSGFTGQLKVMGTKVEDNVAQFGQKYGPAVTAAGAATTLLSTGVEKAFKLVDLLRGSTEASTAATEADISVTEASTAAVSADATAAGTASAAESALAKAEGAAAVSAAQAASEVELLSIANAEAATSAEAATAAITEEGAAGRGSMLGMAGAAGVAGIALVGAGFLVSKMMSESHKEAEEGKAAFDAYWTSVTANRSQTNLQDLIAENADLKKQIDSVVGSMHGMSDHTVSQVIEVKKLDEAYKANAATIATYQSNISALSAEFHMSSAAVEDLANKNSINLGGAIDGIETKFQGLLGGTEDQITQMAALSTQYGVGAEAITTFATAQKITLDGTVGSTAAFRASVTAQQDTGSASSVLAADYDKLYSSLSSVTDKESAFAGLLDQLIGTQLSAGQAADNFQQKVNDLGGALDKNSRSLGGQSDSAIANRKSIEDLITAATNATDAVYKQSGSVDEANASYDIYYSKIVAAAKANGINGQSLADLLSSMNALPAQVATTLGATAGVGTNAGTETINAFAGAATSGASESMITAAMAAAAANASKSLPDFTDVGANAGASMVTGFEQSVWAEQGRVAAAAAQIANTARYALQGQSAAAASSAKPGRASGGPVVAGATYRVGERGPETLVMGASASGVIHPGVGGGIDLDPMINLLRSIDRKLSDGIDATNGVASAVSKSDGLGPLLSEIRQGKR